MKLNADLTQRANRNIHQILWEDSPAKGVQRRRLECDDDHAPVERVTTVVRFAENSAFSAHHHDGGEEFLVLEGVFSDEFADYPAGYYVRNPPGTRHKPHSRNGCTILVKLWQMPPGEKQQLAINTLDETLWKSTEEDAKELPLFESDYEYVSMLKWTAGYNIDALQYEGGVEYFLVEGAFKDAQGSYTTGSWLRLPASSSQDIEVMQDSLVLRKSGHLKNPVTYA